MDLMDNLKSLRGRPKNAANLDSRHIETLAQLGLVELTKSILHTERGATQTVVASLTAKGRQRLAEIDHAGAMPSPVGEKALAQLSDEGLLALHAVSCGESVDPQTAAALVRMNLLTDAGQLTHGGGSMLHTHAAQERLQAILSPWKRG